MSLSEKFHDAYAKIEEDPNVEQQIADMIVDAPESPERDGLMALLYHEGIGLPVDLDKCFDLAEKAASEADPLGYFLLGYMCDNAETPDQAEGGPRQKYDHYDAEHFYELCSKTDSAWAVQAKLWLGNYYLDSAQGGDPEIGVEYLESIADINSDAAAALSDYYWNLVMPEYFDDEDWTRPLVRWTKVAVESDPEEFSYRMGWIYADGIGCRKSFDKAEKYFLNAYNYGDYRGAKAISVLYEEYLDEHPDVGPDERKEIETKIETWKERADKMYAESLTNSIEELDFPVEED